MINTRHEKIEFGQTVSIHRYEKEIQQNTKGSMQGRAADVKITQKDRYENSFSGYRQVNYADQKVRQAYRKVNKMLGGN